MIGIVCALVLIAPAAAPADTCLGADEEVSRAELTPAAERTLLCMVNMHRQSNGVAALAAEPGLTKAAGRHSKAMVLQDFFGHVNPISGSTDQSRAKRAGYPGLVGENLAFTSTMSTTRHIFDLWKHSEGHDRNMLDPSYAVAGMGFELGWPDELAGVPPAGLTGTQVFGVEPTAEATDTALDLVVSDQCAAAHVDLAGFKAEQSEAKADQKHAAARVAKRRKRLAAAETATEIEVARAQLKAAKQDLKEARSESDAAEQSLQDAEAKTATACGRR